MKTTKTCWYLWWGWNPEKVEKWLEEMQLKGWHLHEVDRIATRFKFKKDDSKKARYCVDYQPYIEAEYTKLFNDDGWEMIETTADGWYIWRKYYTKERPSIYTESNSLIERNNKIVKSLSSICLPLILIFLGLVSQRDFLFVRYLMWLYVCIFLLYGGIYYKLKKSNDRLKKINSIKDE